jgi:murein DD-endopeptidase MepM/ murein hydrolase activator NlpD
MKNTKISLSFLAITGALLSAEGAYAQTSLPNVQSLVINDTSDTQVSGVNNPTHLGLIDREAVQLNDHNPKFGNKGNSIDRNDVSNRNKDREESEIGTANSERKVDLDPLAQPHNSRQSGFERDDLDRDLVPSKGEAAIVDADRTNNRQQSRFDREDLARRDLSIPSLLPQKPKSADLARRSLSVPNLSSPKSADSARRNLSVPNLSPPKSEDSVRRSLSIPNLSPPKGDEASIGDRQTNVFSSDLAVRGTTPKQNANVPAKQTVISIAIPVPQPRTKTIARTPKVTPKVAKGGFAKVGNHQSNVFSSDVAVIDRSTKIIDRSTKIFDRSTKVSASLPTEPLGVAISIPVSAPRTQKIIKVPSVTRIPAVAKIKPIAPAVPAIPMGQEGYATPVAKIKPIAPAASAIPLGSAGYPTAAAKSKPIPLTVPAIPMGQGGYATPVAKIKPIAPAIPMGQGGYATGRSTPMPTEDGGMPNSATVAIYPLLNPAPVTSKFGWRTHPLTGKRRFHAGVDIGAPMGAPVVATGSGTVVSAGWKAGYGKTIVIQHNGVQQTLYGHLSEISVASGQSIAQGTVIGLVGSTGNSTGPHLHFETRTSNADGWVAVDPIADVNYAMDSLKRSMPYVRKDVPPGL